MQLSHVGILSLQNAQMAMLMVVVLLVFRLLLRRNWAAFIALHLLFTAGFAFNPQPESQPLWLFVANILAVNIVVATAIGLVLRFGLVSLFGGMFMMIGIGGATLTSDFGQWYAGSGLVTILFVLALAIWAFYISLAGRPLFKDSVLD